MDLANRPGWFLKDIQCGLMRWRGKGHIDRCHVFFIELQCQRSRILPDMHRIAGFRDRYDVAIANRLGESNCGRCDTVLP